MNALGEIPFFEDESDYGMECFYFRNGTGIVKDYNEEQYCCVDSNTMKMEVITTKFVGREIPADSTISLQYSNNLLFALVKIETSENLLFAEKC